LLRCPPEGECPPGFNSYEGSLLCVYAGGADYDAGVGMNDGGGGDAGPVD
jgi:hypothetical protein